MKISELMRIGTLWYPRLPTSYLGGVQGMSRNEHAVYSVVLELIYQNRGSANNDPSWIAGWISDMGSAAVRKAIASLVEKDKLIVEGDKLTEKTAKKHYETKENLSEKRAVSGRIGGGSKSDLKGGDNENSDLGQAKSAPKVKESKVDTPKPPEGGQQKGMFDEEDLPDEKPKSRSRKKPQSQFPEEWRPDAKQRERIRGMGYTDAHIDDLVFACVNYHRSKGNLFASHASAFATWVANDKRYGKTRQNPSQGVRMGNQGPQQARGPSSAVLARIQRDDS